MIYRIPPSLYTLRAVGMGSVQAGVISMLVVPDLDEPCDIDGGGRRFWDQVVRDIDPNTGDRLVTVEGDPPDAWVGREIDDTTAYALAQAWAEGRGANTPLRIEARKLERIKSGAASGADRVEYARKEQRRRAKKKKGGDLTPGELQQIEAKVADRSKVDQSLVETEFTARVRPLPREHWGLFRHTPEVKKYKTALAARLRAYQADEGAQTWVLVSFLAHDFPDLPGQNDIGPLDWDGVLDELDDRPDLLAALNRSPA